jgi:plastocyanin
MKRHRHLALLVFGMVLVAGCSGDDNCGGTVTPNSTITIVTGAFNKGAMAFSPPSDTVHVGDVVRMQNGDNSTNHRIQPDAGTFQSWGSLPGGTGSNVTATAAGTYGYHCVVGGHTMTGTLVVVP